MYVLERGTVIQNGYRCDLGEVKGVMTEFLNAARASGVSQASGISVLPEMETDFWVNLNSGLGTVMEFGGAAPDGASRSEGIPKRRRSIYTHKQAQLFSDTGGPHVPGIPGRTKRRNSMQLLYHPETSTFAPMGGGSEEIEEPSRSVTPPKPIRRNAKPSVSSPLEISLTRVFSTVWPALDARMRLLLVLGFVFAFVHAAATPVFSYALARLLASVLDTRKDVDDAAQRWSLIIIAIAFTDSTSTFCMHYLLEVCGQAWVDRIRVQALSKVLSQSRTWFDREKNSVGRIVEDLEKHAEEMRNLLGRFAAYSVVGVSMTFIGVAWSFTASWRLTFVGVAVAPAMYGISRGLNWASDRWEGKCNEAAETTGAVLHEAITNIRTVRNFVLERYFRQKYFGAIHAGLRLGVKRSLTEGLGFGLSDSAILFATGRLRRSTV